MKRTFAYGCGFWISVDPDDLVNVAEQVAALGYVEWPDDIDPVSDHQDHTHDRRFEGPCKLKRNESDRQN